MSPMSLFLAEDESKLSRTVLYFHGGAYITCSVATHQRMISALAREADTRVLAVNYRLAPQAGHLI
eukprot:351592-Prorocentrum_minimum.AAC.1